MTRADDSTTGDASSPQPMSPSHQPPPGLPPGELPPEDLPLEGLSPQERERRADHWEAGADLREHLADEREQLADEREELADERERMADRQQYALNKRRPGPARPGTQVDPAHDEEEAAAARAAVRRAEAAVQRAEAELERARQAAARVRARAALRIARVERVDAARDRLQAVDAEESAWSAERRDFVAAERDVVAAERDAMADRRDDTADVRDRLADERERELLDQEQRLIRRGPAGRRVRAGETPDTARATGDRRRRSAAVHVPAEWGPQAYGPMLLASFAPLARQLFDDDDLPAALTRVLKFTAEAVAGCDSAGVTMLRRGRAVEIVTSDADAAELDDVQFATGIGPAPEATYGEHPVYVPDLAATPRWPIVAATAAELGIRSVLCFGLHVNRPAHWSALGTFTLYSTAPDAFGEDDHDFGGILAAYLAVAIATAQRRDEVDRREAALHRGLSSRDVIGQAKGILMERRRLSAGEAFDQLRHVSQRLNRRLTDVAQHLADTGEVPT